MKCGTCGSGPKLRNRVVVQKLKSGLTPNAGGHVDETNDANWTDDGRQWCELITRGSREFFRGQEIAADITHQVTMRWSPTAAEITTDMRLKMDGRKLYIKAPPIDVDEKNEWLVFPTAEIK